MIHLCSELGADRDRERFNLVSRDLALYLICIGGVPLEKRGVPIDVGGVSIEASSILC